MSKIKMCMSGPSGTGKSTLSKYIEETYKVPFITTSTKPLWVKHGITSHQELLIKTHNYPQWGLEFQHEVLDYRIKTFTGVDEFVTDRSPLCNLAYFLMQNSSDVTETQTLGYINRCKEAMKLFNSIIVLPFNNKTILENDGMRIPNKYYQMYTNAVFALAANTMLKKELNSIYGDTIEAWDMDARKGQVAMLVTKILKHKD